MPWKFLSPDEWSALGTVVAAVAAVLNLVVVIVLLIFNKRALAALRDQSNDLHAQTQVATQTYAELSREKKRHNGREFLRLSGRLLDLNDEMLALKGANRVTHLEPSGWKMQPKDWHEMFSLSLEYWPEGTEKLVELERKLRETDLALRLLSSPLNNDEYWKGRNDLDKFLDEALALVKETAGEIVKSKQNPCEPSRR